MMTLVLRSLPRRALLVVVTIWTALNVTSSEISETGNLSGHRLAERSAAPDKILSGTQGGDRGRRILKDLAQGSFSVSERRLAERSAAPDKIFSGAQGGDRRRRIIKDLAQGNVSVSEHRLAKRSAAPDKNLSGTHGGDRQRKILKELSQGNFSVSERHLAERSAVPDKILSSAQGGDRQRRIVKDLAPGDVSVSERRLAERNAAPDKILSGAHGGDRRRRIIKDLAQGNVSFSGRQAPAPIPADTEVRRLRLYQVHTGELLAVTYKRDGRYIPSAMAQLDYFLRDWRSNSFVSISGETIDLLWELHEELGSNQPIHIISGFRSAQTNALLKRIGRNVANRSEHMLGRAIDVQFPDVPLKVLRNRALVRQAGGVGYYPAGNGGFVHIDSGRVRHWPGISRTELAEIFAKPTGDRGIGDQQAALGSENAGAQQQNGKRAGSNGRPASWRPVSSP